MLPDWLIKKIDKPKEKFIQEELRIEEYPLPYKKEEIKEEFKVIIIDLF